MNPISVLILVLIVVAAIFVITYVAHDRVPRCVPDAMAIVQTVAKSRKKRISTNTIKNRKVVVVCF